MAGIKPKPKISWGSSPLPAEITTKTQAAMDMVKMAESLGFFDRLILVMSRRCGRFGANATDSPSLTERRKKEWHGEDGKKEVTGSEDHISTGDNGVLKLSELPAKERWKVFQQRERQEKEKQNSKKSCQED
jgi:hypothetical protein